MEKFIHAIYAVASGITGLIVGLFLPWVRWAIEKRRLRYEYRKELIKTWREAIAKVEYDFADARSTFGNSVAYSSLRAHMLPKIIQQIEAPRTFHVGGSRGGAVTKHMLLDEVSRLEKKWKLL